MSRPSCPVLVFIVWPSFPCFLPCLYYPNCLLRQSCPICLSWRPVLASYAGVLSRLSCQVSCPSCPVHNACPQLTVPAVLSLMSNPVCTVLADLSELNCQGDLSRLSCFPVPFFMTQMSCPECCHGSLATVVLPVALSLLSCSGPPVLSFMSCLYIPAVLSRFPVQVFLSLLSFLAVSQLSWPGILFPNSFFGAVLSLLSCSHYPVLSVLSWMPSVRCPVPGVLHTCCLGPGCPYIADLK